MNDDPGQPAPSPPTTSAAGDWKWPLLLATGLDLLALATLVLAAGAPSIIASASIHVLAVCAAGFPTAAGRSQRTLMAALTLALPPLGAPVVMVVLATHRRGEVGQVPAREAPQTCGLTVADVHRLTDGLSASESLMSGSAEERSATVGMLTRNPDAVSITLLRRAVAVGDADLAVEAALALEELGAQLEARAATVHDDLDDDLDGEPGFERALADADMLATAVHSGLPDSSVVAPLVADARRCYQRAEALSPQRLPEIARRWALLELDALCPADGLAVLDRAAAAGGHQFDALRDQVARNARLPERPHAPGHE